MNIREDIPTIMVDYIEAEREWVATCPSYPSLSWFSGSPHLAYLSLLGVIKDIRDDIYMTDLSDFDAY